jgi:hypothetical protein
MKEDLRFLPKNLFLSCLFVLVCPLVVSLFDLCVLKRERLNFSPPPQRKARIDGKDTLKVKDNWFRLDHPSPKVATTTILSG